MLLEQTPEGRADFGFQAVCTSANSMRSRNRRNSVKQLLMVAGSQILQIVRCFRDEDLRPNRQPNLHS